MKKHNLKTIRELCNYLGEDLDHPMCKELARHLQECPECQFYLETIKLTVNLFRDSHPPKPVPEEIKKKLLSTFPLKK